MHSMDLTSVPSMDTVTQRLDVCPSMQNDATSVECTQALNQLCQVLERSIEASLEGCLDAVEVHLSRILTSEQRKADFLPAAEDTDKLDRPTWACQMVVAVVKALMLEAQEQLRSEPASAFLAEVCAPVAM
jgi:hypothetical protein